MNHPRIAPAASVERLLADLIDTASLPLEHARSLPPAFYSSEAIYQLEVERIFSREWMCVARVDQVAAAGDYLAVDLVGEPIVIVRDETGVLHALSRVCRHRSMDLLNGAPQRGTTNRFVCPYHLWSYQLDGRLAGAPEMQRAEGFERADCRLHRFALEVWQGFIFVNLDADAPPLAPRLTEVDALLEGIDLSTWLTVSTLDWGDVAVNWKVVIENACECYHHMGAHRETLQPIWPAATVTVDHTTSREWMYGRMRVSPAMAAGEDSGYPIQPIFLPPIAGLSARQRSETLIVGVFPMFFFAFGPDALTWFRWFPSGPRSHFVDIHVIVPPQSVPAPGFEAGLAMLIDGLRAIQNEDVLANSGVQRGLNARAAAPGRLSHLEQPLWQFQRYLAHRLTGADT